MKKSLFILLSLAIFAACEDDSEESSPVQEDGETMEAVDVESDPLDFDKDVQEADLIAEVTITEKLEEVDEGRMIPYTIFEAAVDHTMKGAAEGEIIIQQDGISDVLVNGAELLQTGESYIFFLKETTSVVTDYSIIGEETGIFLVQEDEAVKQASPSPVFEDIEIHDINEADKNVQRLDKNELIQMIEDENEAQSLSNG